jgi:hypothetical protein
MAGAIQLRVQLEHRPVRLVGRKRRAGIQKISILKFWRDLVVAFEFTSTFKKGAYPAPAAGSSSLPSPLNSPHLKSERVAGAPTADPSCHRGRRDAYRIQASSQGAQRGVACGLQLLDRRRQVGSASCHPLLDGMASSARALTFLVGSRSLLFF